MTTIQAQWDTTTRGLVQFAERARYDVLPADVVRACKLRLMDTLASALGACDAPLSEAALQVAARTRVAEAHDAASIWGSTIKTTPESAAFANGVMVRLL